MAVPAGEEKNMELSFGKNMGIRKSSVTWYWLLLHTTHLAPLAIALCVSSQKKLSSPRLLT